MLTPSYSSAFDPWPHLSSQDQVWTSALKKLHLVSSMQYFSRNCQADWVYLEGNVTLWIFEGFTQCPQWSIGSKPFMGFSQHATLLQPRQLSPEWLDSGLTLLPWLLTARVDYRLFDSHAQKCQRRGRNRAEHNGCQNSEIVMKIGFRLHCRTGCRSCSCLVHSSALMLSRQITV